MWEYILLPLGLLLLVKGADFLVDGSIAIANKYNISKLLIGLTLVSIGTSLPELVVNIFAAANGAGGVAFGTVVGSNISNILLVLGIVALISTIRMNRKTEVKEISFSLFAALLLLLLISPLFASNGILSSMSGVVLLVSFAAFMIYAFKKMKSSGLSPKINAKKFFLFELKTSKKIKRDEFEIKKLKIPLSVLILSGILALYVGGKWTAESAVKIASNIGISEYIIALIVIAIGTSLPELITSIKAILKKEEDIAFGNIIGSNVANILLVLGISSVLKPIVLPEFALIDVVVLCFVSILLIVLALRKKSVLGKRQGIVLISLYVFYVLFLVLR